MAQMETTLDAVRDKLENGLPAKIDAINGEDESLQIAHPTAVTVGVKQALEFPRVFVIPATTTMPLESAGRIHFEHRIAVVSYVAAWEEDHLTRYLLRYQRACREVCLVGRRPTEGSATTNPAGYSLHFERDEYGSHFQLGANAGELQGQFVQFARTIFKVRQQQDLA